MCTTWIDRRSWTFEMASSQALNQILKSLFCACLTFFSFVKKHTILLVRSRLPFSSCNNVAFRRMTKLKVNHYYSSDLLNLCVRAVQPSTSWLSALCDRAKTRSDPASTSLPVDTWREREGISEQWCDESRKMQCVNQSRSRADCLAAAPLTHIVSPILILHYPVIFRVGDTFTNHPVLLSYIPAFVRLFLTRCPCLPAVWFGVSTDFRILCWCGWSIYTLVGYFYCMFAKDEIRERDLK